MACIGGGFLLVPIALQSVANFPSWRSPGPVASILPMFVVESYAGAVAPAIGFILCAIPIVVSRRALPALPFSIAVLTALLSAWWFWIDWDPGFRYHPREYVVAMAYWNVVLGTFAIAASVAAIVIRSFWASIAAMLLAWAWLAWCAFPWLGEY